MMSTMADDDKMYMLNALWYKPDGGAAKYQEYLDAALPHVKRYGGRLTDSYHPDESLIGEFDADLVFFVEWPSQKSFDKFRLDPDVKKTKLLREAAIRDSLLIRCSKI
jgi:uncharacterized protein (DUF1330 family)